MLKLYITTVLVFYYLFKAQMFLKTAINNMALSAIRPYRTSIIHDIKVRLILPYSVVCLSWVFHFFILILTGLHAFTHEIHVSIFVITLNKRDFVSIYSEYVNIFD